MDTELPLADELAAVFARMSGLLLSTETAATVLELVTALAKEVIPDTDGAGVTLYDDRGEPVTRAATDPVVSTVDELQYEFAEGPCISALEQRAVVRVDDLTQDDRWPRWARTAAGTGMRSVLSASLVAGGEVLGAMKTYSHRPGAYGARAEHLLGMFAAQATVLLAGVRSRADAERVSDELRDSMRARDVVNIAKGVLMARESVDEQSAFLLLTRMARTQGRPLRELADGVAGATVRRRR
jgi:GAF domain-containing protein